VTEGIIAADTQDQVRGVMRQGHELAIERLRRGAIDGAARGTPGRGQDAAEVPGDVGGAAGIERVVEGRISEQDNVRGVE
jgi:hypothetical protein